jgi:hypothetical protein
MLQFLKDYSQEVKNGEEIELQAGTAEVQKKTLN